MAIDIEPFYDRVVVKLITEETTASGLIIPETSREKHAVKAEVVAVGPGQLIPDSGARSEMSCQVGNKVYINQYAGTKIEINGDEHIMLRDTDILGRVVS